VAPVFQAVGTAQSGTGALTVAWPTHLTNDIGILVIETGGDDTTLSITAPTGWVAIAGSPVIDVATAAGSKLQVWWKRAASAAETSVTVPDSGNHQVAAIYTFRGCIPTGNPWNVATTGTKTTASTTATVPSLTTTVPGTLFVAIVGRPDDSASTTHFGTLTNTNLTGNASAGEAGTTSGHGGGFVVEYGTFVGVGSTGTSTLTKAASTTDTYMALALRQAASVTASAGAFTLAGQAATTKATRKFTADSTKYFLPERNLVRWSEQFEQGYWTKNLGGTGLAPVVTANDATAPDGTLTADKIVFDLNGGTTTTDRSDLQPNTATPTVIGITYIFSIWLKTTDGSSLAVQFSHNGASVSLVTVTGTWQRFTSTSYTAADTGRRPRVGLRGASGTGAFASLHVWGLQHEVGTAITDYDPTGPAAAAITNTLVGRNLVSSAGSFTFAGNPATLTRQYSLAASVGSFAEVGQDAALTSALKLTSAAGAFTVAGNAATLKRALNLTSASGNFELTGIAASLLYDRRLVSALGTYSVTGNAATPRKTIALISSVGSFALTGIASSLKTTRYLSGGGGTFIETGQDAGLKQGLLLAGSTASFALTGNAATFRRNYSVLATSGSFAVSSLGAGFNSQKRLASTAGSFAVTGNPGSLRRTYLFLGSAGAFSETGNAAALNRSLKLTLEAGAFDEVANPAGLFRACRLASSAGAYSETGNAANLKVGHVVVGSATSFEVTGGSASLVTFKIFSATAGAFTVAGSQATFRHNRALAATPSSFTLAGQGVGFNQQRRLNTVVGSLTLIGNSNQFRRTLVMVDATGAFLLTGSETYLIRRDNRPRVVIFM
jgi:hypothetical protein